MKFRLSFGLLILFIFGSAIFYSHLRPVRSVPPSSIKNVLSSSQLSYFAVLSPGNTAGNSTVQISTLGPSKTTSNLFAGDTLAIGVSATQHFYIVKDVGNTAIFQLHTGTSAVDVGASAVAIATRSATHTISFQPNSSYNNGRWEFLIKVSNATSESYNDRIPDMNGFDLGGVIASDITCPGAWGGVAAVGATVSITVGAPAVTSSYQSFTCTTPTGNSITPGTTATVVIGGTNKMINPSPNHASINEGSADVYTFIIRHYDGASALVDADTTTGKIAVVESVRITATVDSTLTFTIENSGLGIGGSNCGVPLSSNQSAVTATAVPFGSLLIGSTGNNLAQRLSVVTNGAGYAVTAYEAYTMRNLDGTGTTIPDTDCDTNACTMTVGAGWTGPDAAKSEFGYSLQALNVGPTLGYTVSPTNFTARPFGLGAANAQTIFYYNATPASIHFAAVCYRITATTSQKAGDYENQVVYTATSIF